MIKKRIENLESQVKQLRGEVYRLRNLIDMVKYPEKYTSKPGPKRSVVVAKRDIALTVCAVAGDSYRVLGERYKLSTGRARDIVRNTLNRYVIPKLKTDLPMTTIRTFRDNKNTVNSILIKQDKELS